MFEGLLQPMHLFLIAIIAMIFLGPKRLPELGRGLGEGIRGFKDALSGGGDKTDPAEPPKKIEPKIEP
jgi:sec-independent protein translocase protein TatA